uniref:Cyanate lyase C-terminal domain-containing protein n=1 Tax=Ananas comosus var. bracteatus TaxID=296719 RepID=A0A6V7PZF9_ANACO|nr:unnamed protein product [Ananas comosus var. bracteatus]
MEPLGGGGGRRRRREGGGGAAADGGEGGGGEELRGDRGGDGAHQRVRGAAPPPPSPAQADTAPALRRSLPALSDDLLDLMMAPPFRSYHPTSSRSPPSTGSELLPTLDLSVRSCSRVLVATMRFRVLILMLVLGDFDRSSLSIEVKLVGLIGVVQINEAVMHFGESIKEIINEEFGDGIMSAIDFYCSVDKVQGVDGKDRVVITFDGKYLPYSEQRSEHMVSRLRHQAS